MKFVHVAILIISFSFTSTTFAGTISFEQSSAKGYFERSLQSAMAEKTKEAFMHKAMQAADTAYSMWEKEALTAYDGAIVTGEDDICFIKTETRTVIQKMLEEALGKFDARCFEIVVPEYAKEELYARINQMMQEDPREDMLATYSAWDENVGDYVQQLLAAIDSQLQTTRDTLLSQISTVTQEYRKGFIETLDEKLNTIHKLIQRDIELYYIGAKNTYFYQHFSDTASLRFYTQQQSASHITAQILASTTDKTNAILQEAQEKLTYTVSGIGVTPEGDDIDMLVQAGIYAWKAAEDDLLAARLSWERSSLDGYSLADEVWAKSYEQLVQKRNEWLASIQQQIRQGVINWSSSFLEADRAYADALKLLDETIAAEKERFDDYSASARELITTGSGSLRIAQENIAWLKEYFTTLTGIAYTTDNERKAYIEWYLQNDSTDTKELKKAIYDQIVQWEGILSRYQDIVARMTLQYHMQDMWGNTITQFKAGEFVKLYTGEETALCDNLHIFKQYYEAYTTGTITDIDTINAFALGEELSKYVAGIQMLHLLGQESTVLPFTTVMEYLAQRLQYQENSAQIDSMREFLYSLYEAYLRGEISYNDQQIIGGNPKTSPWMVSRLDAFRRYIQEHSGNFETLFGCKTVVSQTSGLLSDDSVDEHGNGLYKYYLYKDAEGVVIIDGLYELSGDPYLMTAAEFDLEKEKLTLAYWEERLRRAQKLYNFAYNETERPDAQTQKANLQKATEDYEKAKKDYNDAMALLAGDLKNALVGAQKDVDSAQKQLAQVRIAYEAAQKTYQDAVEIMLYYTNPDAKEMAIQMVNEATRQIIEYTNTIEQKERKWIEAKKNYYGALLLQDRNENAAAYAKRVELAVNALEGYSTSQGEVLGIRAIHSAWQNIKDKSLDESLAAIDENEELLFMKLNDLLPGYEDDERVAYLKEIFEHRDGAKEKYDRAREWFNAWEAIAGVDDKEQMVVDAIVCKLNEVVNGQTPLDAMMLKEQIAILANATRTLDEKYNAIALIEYYTGGYVQAEKLLPLCDEVNTNIYTQAMEVIAGSILENIYNRDIAEERNGQVMYPDWGSLLTLYGEVVQQEYRQNMVNMVYAVNRLGKAIEEAYELARMVVVYLLHDMNGEDVATSSFAKENIIKAAEGALDSANVAFFTRNKESLQQLVDMLQHKKDEVTDSNGNVDWSALSTVYNDLINTCMQKLTQGSTKDALEYAYLYTLATTLDTMQEFQDESSYTNLLQQLHGYIEDMDTVIDLQQELARCTSNDAIDTLLDSYIDMLKRGVDEEGNTLSDVSRHIIEVKVTALTQPDVFDFVHPVAFEGTQSVSVMQTYAHYVQQFYELSLEKIKQSREEGFIGKIAALLGITESETENSFKGSLTVSQLLEYGKKVENYIQTKEYGSLPQALKEALQQVVSAYHDILIQKAKYEQRDSSAQDALAQYQEKTNVYDKLIDLQKKYGELVVFRSAMYGNDENEYTVQQASYQQLSPNGTWPGFTDALISTLNECETLYNEIKDEIDSMQFKDVQTAVFAQLARLEEIRKEYEIVDYTARYLYEGEMYGSVDEFVVTMQSQGKDEAFVQTVVERINRELLRRQDIKALKDNTVSIAQVQQRWGQDSSWILAAYFEGIQKNSYTDAFNALLYDEDFRDFAILEHFQHFVAGYIRTQGYTSYEDIAGTITDSGQYLSGKFANLSQYSGCNEILQYITTHYGELKQLYYGTLVQLYAPDALALHQIDTYTADSESDMYTHFMAYVLSLGNADVQFEEIFGQKTDDGYMPAGFGALTQYNERQDFFTTHYDTFRALFTALTHGRVLSAYSYLPDGVREYVIVSDYYSSVQNDIYSAQDVDTLLACYGISRDERYEPLRTSVQRFIDILDIAHEYEQYKDASIQEYIEKYNITDQKEKNFLILYSINPDLADPVNLIVTNSQVPLVLTGYEMDRQSWEMFTDISNDSDDGLQNLLAMCIYAANRDRVIAQAVYQFVLSQRDTYNHWRDFADVMEQYYNDYTQNGDSLSLLRELIVNEKNLKKVPEGTVVDWNMVLDGDYSEITISIFGNSFSYKQLTNEVDYTYYEDSNNNDQYDQGERYLAHYVREYKDNGLALVAEKRMGLEEITRVESDVLSDNTKSYYTGTDSSYYNEMIDKATYMAAALDMLVQVAQMATQTTDTFVLYDEEENQVDIAFIHDVEKLIQELQATGYSTKGALPGSESEEEGNVSETPLAMAQKVIDRYIEAGQDARVQELVDSMKTGDAQVQYALLKAYADIEKLGPILLNNDLQDYLESPEYKNAQQIYTTNKALFEQAQAQVNNSLKAYQQAQDAYTKQLEIITLLYNRLEEARKLKEDEEMLYAYATTPYLYNSQTNAEGGDPDDIESKLKADATQQYQLALQYRDEVKQKIETLQQKVEVVKQQKVENDQQYVKVKQELIERAQRAYRMEKAAWCMQNEIKKLSVAYEQLKAQYEAKKDAFIAATNDDYTDERDRLIDRMLQDNFINGVVSIGPFGIQTSLMNIHLNEAAYFYNEHHSWYGMDSRILSTKPLLGGDIPDGDTIVRMNSPLYEYLNMMRKDGSLISSNVYIQQYFSEFLKAEDWDNKYDNLSLEYAGTYEIYRPIKEKYDYFWNKKVNLGFKKIYPYRWMARILRPVLIPLQKLLNVIYKYIIEAEKNKKQHKRNADKTFTIIHSKLTELQSLKIKMLAAKADLARYTEIESLDDAQKAGAFEYNNPKTMQTVLVQKPTLKAALKEVAGKYGLMISDSDLKFLVETDAGGDWVNVNNYRTTAQKTDSNGYTTNETMQVLHAGTVGQTYANIMNQQKRDAFGRYMAHVQSMYTQGGFDRVVVDRAVEKDLYGIWAGDSSDYGSALKIGLEARGMVRAMLTYMGYVEGMPADVINQLDAMIGTEREDEVAGLFAQYVKQYEGFNDRELAQRRALQVHQWQLKKQELADKKADWDRMVSRIFNRGIQQWEMMLKSFENRWKNWRIASQEAIVEGNAQWDARMQKLQEEKMAWLIAAQSGVGYKELQKRMASIEVVLNDMLSSMKKEYGDVIQRVDVHALLLDILKDQPELLHEELMKLSKQKVEFGLTQLSYRSYNRAIFDQAQILAEEFARVQEKTGNVALLKALTELLQKCRQQIEAANEQAELAALQFVSGYNFGIDGNRYTRKLAVSDREQKIQAYRPFVFYESLLLGTYSIPTLMELYNNDDGVRFAVTMNVVMNQVNIRIGMMMRPDVPWGFTYYVGEFGQIEPGPKLKNKGKGEYGRITKEVYEAEKQKATEDVVCQYVNSGIAVTLSIATGNPMVGAAYMSWNQLSGVATGDLSMQQWAVQTGISVGASAVGGYTEGVTGSAVYGSMASSTIQGFGNFIEYKPGGGLGLQWGSKDQWRSFGIGAATALVGAKLGQMYGKSWNGSWQQYGYTASSSYLVNRFDGQGSWKDDMLQAGASTVALIASNELMAQDTVLGQYIEEHNAITPMNRFIQGTLENVLLATGGMWIGKNKGQPFGDLLLMQNWSKTQYTLSDYAADRMSEYFKDKAQKQAEEAAKKAKEMDTVEGLAGLGWLGLRMGKVLSSAWDMISEWFESVFGRYPQDEIALQRKKEIEESKKMWEDGTMQKEVDKNILSREAKYIKEIQDSYQDKEIRNSDGNQNNIKEYNGNSVEVYERLMYYEAVLRSKGFDGIDDWLEQEIPLIIGEEGKGSGLLCTDGNGKPTGDTYNDRITKIYVDKEGNVHIEEYYRANIDVKITSKNSSVAQGEYDFVVGTHGDDKFMALNIFKNNKEVLEKIISSIKDPKEQNKIWKALNNNEIDYGMIKGREEFRLLPATNGKTQLWINLHGGSNSSTDSEGCFT
ncbi:MAG: hypothetical protein WHV26_11270, partial [Spirochaetota bacterium]